MKFGKLTIRCIKGVELKAGQTMMVKADPYVKLTIGSQTFQTKAHANGGKNPVWEEDFSFNVSNEKELLLEVYDQETKSKDKLMGTAKVSILNWIAQQSFEGSIDILDSSGKPAGKVDVAAKFEKPEAGAAPMKPPSMPPGSLKAPPPPPRWWRRRACSGS